VSGRIESATTTIPGVVEGNARRGKARTCTRAHACVLPCVREYTPHRAALVAAASLASSIWHRSRASPSCRHTAHSVVRRSSAAAPAITGKADSRCQPPPTSHTGLHLTWKRTRVTLAKGTHTDCTSRGTLHHQRRRVRDLPLVASRPFKRRTGASNRSVIHARVRHRRGYPHSRSPAYLL